MHPLALEDVVHVHQRAKVDAYDNGLFIVVRIPDESHAQYLRTVQPVFG